MYFHYFIFFSLCFRSLPLPSATCDRQAGGESSPIRLVPILCWVEFPPHPFGRSSCQPERVLSVVPANSAQSVWCMPLKPQFQLDSVDDLNLLGGLPVLVCSACCYVIGKSSVRRDPLSPPCATPHPHPHPYTHAHSHTWLCRPSSPLHRRLFAHGPLALPHIVILPADSTTRHVLVE